MNLPQIKKVYFVGIGGIGMSALARYFKSKEVSVSGSDRDMNSDVVKGLISEDIEVVDQENLKEEDLSKLMSDADIVIYTVAIPEENIELFFAKSNKKPLFTYAEMLGRISEDKFTIAVAGTHGKTTTTAMTAEIAHNLGLKPNVVVGSFLNWGSETGEIIKTNFISGDSELFIVEACEYKRSFLNLNPNILIITNLEADHLDYYKDLQDVQQAFYDLASKLPEDGKIICQAADPNLKNIVLDFSDKIVDYTDVIEKVPEMVVFGDHNKANAAAAISAIQSFIYLQKSDIEIESDKICEAVKTFKGTWRRMEFKGELESGVKIYDDYGHHPTEVEATLKSFREHFPNNKILVVFQPHLHSRTRMFFNEFVNTLSAADRSIIYPIYQARDEEDYGVSSKILVDRINEKTEKFDSDFVDSFDEIVREIKVLEKEWIVILLGAGEIYQISDKLDFVEKI